MASQQPSTTLNNQQSLTKRTDTVPSSNEVFRPPAIKDIPELSQENILNMLK
jgi:lysozyme family protein